MRFDPILPEVDSAGLVLRRGDAEELDYYLPAPDVRGMIYHSRSSASGSLIGKFRRCPALYAQTEMLGVKEIDNPFRKAANALEKGILFHCFTAQHYGQKMALAWGRNIREYLGPAEAVQIRAEQLGRAAQAFAPTVLEVGAAYQRVWLDEPWDILGVEREFELEGLPCRHTRSADLVVYDRRDRVIKIVDTKTTAFFRRSSVESYSSSDQFLDYNLIGAQCWGQDFGGAWINFVEWPRQGRVEFSRVAALAAPAMVAGHLDDLRWHYALAEKLAVERDPRLWPKTQQCHGPYGMCPIWESCRRGERGKR